MIKKTNKILILITLLIISYFIFLKLNNKYENTVTYEPKLADVEATSYYDYSEVTEIDDDYSYSSIYLTKDTEINLISQTGELKINNGKYGDRDIVTSASAMKPGAEVKILITKCAVNKKAELLDVVLTVNNIKTFKNHDTGSITFSINIGNVQVPENQKNPSTVKQVPLGKDKPIEFGFSTTYAQADFTMQYFKTGTYNKETGTGEDGGITHVNGFYRDLDVPVVDNNKEELKDETLQGNEGIIPRVGKTSIYYNKKKTQPDETYNHTQTKYELSELENGIAAKFGTTAEVNAYWFATTAFVLTENIQNSKFTFTYSGFGCGISYFFSSPYPYDSSAPVKTANMDHFEAGRQFNYQISQYIANNYYGSLFSYKDLYENFHENTKYESIEISDEINSRLKINQDEVKILNEVGENQTGYWEITVDGQNVKAVAKKDALENANFYAHTYTLVIPVTFPLTETDLTPITNTAKTTFGMDKATESQSSQLILNFKYRLTVHYYDKDTGEEIADPDIYFYDPNASYTTSPSKVGADWSQDGTPDNAKGTINKDTDVNYYFTRVIENPDTGSFIHIIVITMMIMVVAALVIISQKHHKIYKV